MKVKIRGLLFGGFAAAVFAQSAMATDPTPVKPASAELADTQSEYKKTVTSKYYTNETFQGRELNGLGYNTTTQEYAKKSVYVPWKYGEANINKEWVELEGQKQLANGATEDTEYVEIKHAGKGVDKHYIKMNTDAITVDTTDGSVTTTGADKIRAAGNTANNNVPTDLEKGRLTTAKAVYDFVTGYTGDTYQPKLTAADGPQSGQPVELNIGFWDSALNNNAGDSTWGKVKAQADGAGGTGSVGYLAITGTTSRGVYEVNIDASKIVNAADALATAATSATATDNKKLTTAKAVYDYAQPRAATTAKAQIGYKADSNTASTWNTIQAAGGVETTGASKNYVTMPRDSSTSTYNINLAAEKITTTGDQIIAATGDGTGENGDLSDLPTVGAVKDYVQSVTNGNTLPEMPEECGTAQNTGVHCALVSSWDNETGAVVLEWTVMAQNVE